MAYVRLQEMGESGAYLVRDSQNQAGDYAISYLSKLGQIHHFKINAICGDYYIGGRQFSSLGDMIGYYANCSCILENERLEVPVLPPKVFVTIHLCSFVDVSPIFYVLLLFVHLPVFNFLLFLLYTESTVFRFLTTPQFSGLLAGFGTEMLTTLTERAILVLRQKFAKHEVGFLVKPLSFCSIEGKKAMA